MTLRIYLPNYTFSFLSDRFFSILSSLDKRILAIVAIAFTSLIACIALYKWRCYQKKNSSQSPLIPPNTSPLIPPTELSFLLTQVLLFLQTQALSLIKIRTKKLVKGF